MKKTIQWHKDCLRNVTESAARKRDEAKRVCAEADRIENYAAFMALQIASAEKAGKDGFDSERYMAKSSNNDYASTDG